MSVASVVNELMVPKDWVRKQTTLGDYAKIMKAQAKRARASTPRGKRALQKKVVMLQLHGVVLRAQYGSSPHAQHAARYGSKYEPPQLMSRADATRIHNKYWECKALSPQAPHRSIGSQAFEAAAANEKFHKRRGATRGTRSKKGLENETDFSCLLLVSINAEFSPQLKTIMGGDTVPTLVQAQQASTKTVVYTPEFVEAILTASPTRSNIPPLPKGRKSVVHTPNALSATGIGGMGGGLAISSLAHRKQNYDHNYSKNSRKRK
jgi:hypothetical protein